MAIRTECVINLADANYLEIECPKCNTQTKLTLDVKSHTVPPSCPRCAEYYPEYLTTAVREISKVIFSKEYTDAMKSISIVKIEE